jgi:hypothetical protein
MTVNFEGDFWILTENVFPRTEHANIRGKLRITIGIIERLDA